MNSLPAAGFVLSLAVLVAAQGAPSLEELHARGVEAHEARSLTAASAEYDKVLERDPPRDPTAEEWRTIERFAPRVFTARGEPFGLKDAVAVMHPTAPAIAYHLFWDDDIDFPDDNDPCDHELVWVLLTPDRSALAGYRTYFHGRELVAPESAMRDAAAHGGRPAIVAQWGKHGSMPLGWETLTIQASSSETESKYSPVGRPITLEEYNRGTWRKLSTEGRRMAKNLYAARQGWPIKFTGSWEDFSTFPVEADALALIRSRKAAIVSRWNSAVLNRVMLPYNFRPKTEWPQGVR